MVLPVVAPQMPGLLHGPAVPDGHQHILELPVLRQRVVGVTGDDGGQAQVVGHGRSLRDEEVVVGSQVVLELREHATAEPGDVRDVLRVPAHRRVSPGAVAGQESPRDLALPTAGEQRHPLGVPRQQLVGEARYPLGAIQVRRADHPTQALPAGRVATQQHQVRATLPVADPAQVLAPRLAMTGWSRPVDTHRDGQSIDGSGGDLGGDEPERRRARRAGTTR